MRGKDVTVEWVPFELRPEPHPTLRPEGEYLQRAWEQRVYPLARQMGVEIRLPPVSPQPHTHLAWEGFQFAREHGKGVEYNHRVLEAFFVGGQDIGRPEVLARLAAEVGLDPAAFLRVNRSDIVRLDAIRELQPWSHGDYRVVLGDGSALLWSRRYRAQTAGAFDITA